MLIDPITSSYVALLRYGADRSVDDLPTRFTRQDLLKVLRHDARLKPASLNDTSRGYALRYSGNQRGLIETQYRARYSQATIAPVAPHRYIRLWARTDAGAYAVEPQRYLVRGGETFDAEAPESESFDALLASSGIDTIAPEVERRAVSGLHSAGVHVGYLPALDGEDAGPSMALLWPHDVVVVCHPTIPGDERGVMLCAVRMPAPDVRDTVWHVYQREAVEDEDGTVTGFGPWQWCRFVEHTDDDERPNSLLEFREYPGLLLPVTFLRTEPTEGGFWPLPDRDTLAVSDELNVRRTDLARIEALQAHSQPVVADDTVDADEIPVGPDRVISLRAGGSFSYATPAPAFAEVRANLDETQRTVATVRGNNPDAYATSPAAPESGVARRIRNLPHERRLREMRAAVKRFDERLCRILLDVATAFDPAYSFAPDLQPRTELGGMLDFEDPEAKQRRLLIDLDLGVVSKASYAVSMGHYSSIAAAKEAGLSDEIEASAPAPAPAPALGGIPGRQPPPQPTDRRSRVAALLAGDAEADADEVSGGDEA